MSDSVTIVGHRQIASYPVANIACSIEVYPFEGGKYTIQGGQIISATVSKNIYEPQGSMSVTLMPGGPQGVEDPNTWSQIITPMSHMLIGMTRGTRSAVVMDGIVTLPAEQQVWSNNEAETSVMRAQGLQGADFGWFFNQYNYYALTFYGLTASTPIGNGLGLVPASIASILSKGAQNQPPDQMGILWYQIMTGQSGILAKTYVPYANATQISIKQAITAQWEKYPIANIPVISYFLGEESWYAKFKHIFAEPWYEFFVTTAPSGQYLSYPGTPSNATINAGTSFTMQSEPQAKPAGPMLVARVTPLPVLMPPNGTSGPPGQVDSSRWSQLPLYDFTKEKFGFKSSSASFSCDGARNFYILNPTAYQTLFGDNNANTLPFPFYFIAAGDAASVQRYGFRPQVFTTQWFYDQAGLAAQTGETKKQTFLEMTATAMSWYHPLPLMARANVVLPLTPDILVGTRFRYIPFKNGASWDFYVEGFQHNFSFGGESHTSLTLSRGLPTSVYNNPTLLQAVLSGNAQRVNAEYVVGLPAGSAPSLQFTATLADAAALQQSMTNFVNTPQQAG
jgi:hypothetical protein